MSTLPAVNYITDSARTEGEVKSALEAWLSATKQIPGAGQAEAELTIAGGSITPPGGVGALVIDTESAAATDDLTTIVTTNYPHGSMVLLRNSNAARFVVLKHAATGAGQMFLDRNADYVLDDTKKFILLQRRGTDWYEVLRGPSRPSMPVVAKNVDFTVQKEDLGKVFVCTNAITVSFAAAASLGNGFFCTVINHNYNTSNGVSLDPNSTETIDGNATQLTILLSGQGKLIVCDGSKLYSLNDYAVPSRTVVSFASSITIDATDSTYFEVGALTANITTVTVLNLNIGQKIRVRFVQDATGGRTVAAPAGAKIAGSVASAANQASWLDLMYTFAGNRIEGFWTQIPV